MKKAIKMVSLLAVLFAFIVSMVGCSSEPTVTDVQLMMTADKDEYIIGETFDPTGIMLTEVYSDGTRKEVTDYTYSPDGPLTADDTVVTITYGDYTFENPITVISASDKIVLTLNNGVDRCELHADGTLQLQGGALDYSGPVNGHWSWDGTALKIMLPIYRSMDDFDDFETEMDLKYDEQNNVSFTYLLKGNWTINYFCSYSDWSQVLTPDVTYPLQ